jgi:MFS family permease
VAALFAGRFLQGAVSGVVFSVGSAWLGELVGSPARAARLTTAALSAGWGLGPLTAGILGQWFPAPTVLPYLVYLGFGVPLLLSAIGGDAQPPPVQPCGRTSWTLRLPYLFP